MMHRLLYVAVAAGALLGCGGGDLAPAAAPMARAPQAQQLPVSAAEQARQLMDYAENRFPSIFPGHETTGAWGPFSYRHYAATGVYLGVVTASDPLWVTNGVYVMGGPFGGAPRYVGQLTAFINVVDPSTYILDSFGQIVAGGSDGVGTGDSGADGTAGDGAPIVGATVVVTDAGGRTVSAVTDTVGHYRVKVTGFTPPFVARVTKPDGSKVYTSLNVAPTRTNAYLTMNVTGLTDKIASDVAIAGGKTRATELTPQIVAANTSVIQTSIANLRTAIEPVLDASGLTASTFDPIGTAFRPNHTGYDYVLDNTVVTVAASGATQVNVSPTFNPTYQGTWSLDIVSGTDSVPLGSVPGTGVPTQDQITHATTATLSFPYSALYQSYTVTISGNNIHVTGTHTDFLITVNSYSFSNYQGCGGNCGVGATVQYTMTVNVTSSGTIEGQTQQPATGSSTLTFVYKRTS